MMGLTWAEDYNGQTEESEYELKNINPLKSATAIPP
jgi:hypothetical protein